MVSPSPQAQSRSFEFAVALVILFACVFVGCGGGGVVAGGVTPTPTPNPTPIPTPTPPSAPASIEVSVGNATVPQNGIYQYQVSLTEPKPIGNSSSRPTLPSAPVGPVRSVAINDVAGKAAGVVLINPAGNVSVNLTSPTVSLGTNNTFPIFTMTMPVSPQATTGQVFPASLDGASFEDGSGQTYTILANTPGNLTIGDQTKDQSITDVIPGGGLLPDRSVVKILGQNFTANTKISIEGTTIFFPGDTQFVSSGEIDVTLCNGTIDPAATACPTPGTGATFQLDGERVRATNKDTGATVEYFSYINTDDVPLATQTGLITEVHPMFSGQHYTTATLDYNPQANEFIGLALQNPDTTSDSTVLLEMLDASSQTIESKTIVLAKRTRMVRDIKDLFTPTAQEIKVRATVTAGPPVQMLGLRGDTAAGTVVPVVVTGQ